MDGPEQVRPADAALTALLPPEQSRRLSDDELSALVWAMARAVWVRPQSRKLLEDTAQNVALEVLTRRAEEPNFLSTFGEIIPWVKRAVNVDILKQRRAVADRPEHASDTVTALQAPRDDTNPAAGVEAEELSVVIDQAVAALSSARRQVLDLIRGEGKTRSEAARILGRSESTVKNQLTEALKGISEPVQAYLDSGIVEEPKP